MSQRWIKRDTLFAPVGRRRSTLCQWKHYLYVFGGFYDDGILDELYRFDTITNVWDKLKKKETKVNINTRRSGHTALIYNDAMYCFFGEGGMQSRLLEDTIRFDFQTESWDVVQLRNQFHGSPDPRLFHATCLNGDHCYMYGGFLHEPSDVATLSDFWKFDFKEQYWKEMTEATGDMPPRMLSHSITSVGASVFLYGGVYHHLQSYTRNFNMYEYSIPLASWKVLEIDPIFTPRCNCVMQSTGSFIYFFGGFDERCLDYKDLHDHSPDLNFKNDLYSFDVSRGKWSCLNPVNGYQPDSRTKHSGILSDEGILFIYGGLASNQENLDDLWSISLTPPNFKSSLIKSLGNRSYHDIFFITDM